MDENSGERQPPRRPPAPPLKVNKDSHKIRKPPTAPPPNPNRQAPVIIYEVSPEVHHTNPTEFMGLVQRLTGPPPRPAANEEMEMPPMIATSDSLNHQMGGYGPPGGGPGPPMFSLPVPDPNPFRSMHNPDYYMSNVRSDINEGVSVDGNYIFEDGAPSSSTPNAYISQSHHHQLPSPDSLDNFFNNNIWYHQQQRDDDDNQ